MLAIFRYLLSSAVMSHPHLHRHPSPPARPAACLSAAALSARFRANFSARILPLGSTLAWRYTLFLEIWFVSWLTVSFLLAAAISQRIPPRCAARKRLACPVFRTNSPLLTLILFALYGLFWSFRHKLYNSNTKDFFVLFLSQGHKGCPCDQVEMKIGHNEGLLRELWGFKDGRGGGKRPHRTR